MRKGGGGLYSSPLDGTVPFTLLLYSSPLDGMMWDQERGGGVLLTTG